MQLSNQWATAEVKHLLTNGNVNTAQKWFQEISVQQYKPTSEDTKNHYLKT